MKSILIIMTILVITSCANKRSEIPATDAILNGKGNLEDNPAIIACKEQLRVVNKSEKIYLSLSLHDDGYSDPPEYILRYFTKNGYIVEPQSHSKFGLEGNPEKGAHALPVVYDPKTMKPTWIHGIRVISENKMEIIIEIYQYISPLGGGGRKIKIIKLNGKWVKDPNYHDGGWVS